VTGTYATGFYILAGVGLCALFVLVIAQLSWRKTMESNRASI
jgi:MFS transporter, NNP family, nitrate/nitrite transporter